MCVQEILGEGYILLGTSKEENEGVVLIRTDSNGDSIWSETYREPGNNLNSASFIQITDDGGYIIVGTTGYEDEEYNRWSQLWLIMVDSAGNKIWDREYGEQEWNSPNYGYCVRQTTEGEYILAGQKTSGGFLLLKTDQNGDTFWTRNFGGEYCHSVLVTSEGDYVAVGRGPAKTPWLSLYDGGDVLLVKVDPDGNTIWSRNHGGDDVDVGRWLDQTSDGGYIITGWSGSFVPSGLYLLKTDSFGFVDAIVEEPITEIKNWGIMAPIGSQTTLRYWDFPHGFNASIFDVTGRKADDIKTNASAGTITWGQGFPSGVYFIQVNEANKTSTAKVVLVK